MPKDNIYYFDNAKGGEEGQPHQSLVRTTFSSFSRPKHLGILESFDYFVLKSFQNSWRYKTIFKNLASLGHKIWMD